MARASLRRAGNVRGLPEPLWSSRFLKACRGEPVDTTPVWLMRQAGRYMRSYRDVREGRSFLDLCKDPALAAEVTVVARSTLGVDAAIIFSDILVVLEALGMPLGFSPSGGPQLSRPLTGADGVDALVPPDQAAADLGYVEAAIRTTVRSLPADIPLIGFCGAPFTLASYAIEGGSSRQFARTKTFMYQLPEAWHRLQRHLVATLGRFLSAQIEAGASCVQIFDSWIGTLGRSDVAEFVLPYLKELVAAVPAGIPVILFGTGTAHVIDLLSSTGCDVIGVDATTDLVAAWRLVGGSDAIAVQGNLDPGLLLAPRPRLLAATDALLDAVAGRPGHIFNLGHGVLKETDPEQARALVDRVHEHGATRARPAAPGQD